MTEIVANPLQIKAFSFLQGIAHVFVDRQHVRWNDFVDDADLYRIWPDVWAFPDAYAKKTGSQEWPVREALVAKRVVYAYVPTFASAIEAMPFPRYPFYYLVETVRKVAAVSVGCDEEQVSHLLSLLTQDARDLFGLLDVDLAQSKYAGGSNFDGKTYHQEAAFVVDAFHHGTLEAIIQFSNTKCKAPIIALGPCGIRREGGDPDFFAHVLVPDDLTGGDGTDAENTPGRVIPLAFGWNSKKFLSHGQQWSATLKTATPKLKRWKSLYLPKGLIKPPPSVQDDPYNMALYDLPLVSGPKSLRRLALESFFKPGQWSRQRIADQRRLCREFGLLLLDHLSPKRTRADAHLDDYVLAAREDAEEKVNLPDLFNQSSQARVQAMRDAKRARILETTAFPL